ncbi:hypothetical protein KSS87_000531 [Heliosperma pusillum]|nr:hypothetical protein KSS87_000531 [Heliosperma pusillum]
MGNNTKHALTLSLLYIVITSISLTPNNVEAQAQLHFSSHLLPYPTQPPSHAPAPSPHHHHHHHHHRHAFAPALAPSFDSVSPPQHSKPVTASPPAKAPTAHSHAPLVKPVHSPVKPPSAGPVPVGKRKFVAVQGMVYCKKNCSYSGVNTLMGASPLAGARVVLRCRNTRYLLRKTATTDTNGYFFLEAPPLLTTYGAHKCKVYLAHNTSANSGPCSNATNINNGATGAYLYSNNTGPPSPLPTFSLFSVGPFAYESSKCRR